MALWVAACRLANIGKLAIELALEIVSMLPDMDRDPGAQWDPTFKDQAESAPGPMRFHNRFEDSMAIAAPRDQFAHYLDEHESWFCRCALPMQANLIGPDSYALTIGRFGAFDYYVEPKIGLELLPCEEASGLYRIRTVPVPDYAPPGYEVDFQAVMRLVATDPAIGRTDVTWTLDLTVDIWFPKFILLLPQQLLQSTGDRLLGTIVRQVSRRLTAKVQDDFHASLGMRPGQNR